jgi:transposase
MAGTQADSRSTIQTFCDSVLGLKISLGTIQKILDRVSQAIEPSYKMIATQVRQNAVNHVDETSWHKNGVLMWLWVMANTSSAFFMIHSHRSWEAFRSLISKWKGTLVSDGYGVYRKWVGLRQTCRLRSLKTYTFLVDAVQRYFRGQELNTAWITQH